MKNWKKINVNIEKIYVLALQLCQKKIMPLFIVQISPKFMIHNP